MKKQKIITLILLLTLLLSAIRFERQAVSLLQKKQPVIASQVEKFKESPAARFFIGACKIGEVVVELTLR